ncbi:MAG: glucosylglycerol 3-phosphatase [Cyanobacteria bacterium P01_D01_bin.105]
MSLHQQTLSLDHDAFIQTLVSTENLLIIQDLDGVCMQLVNDPITRQISPSYVSATQAFDPHFYVLTNGEHTGRRGVNKLIERAFQEDASTLQAHNSYLPGLAAGGVQWQSRNGQCFHPGVSDAELSFLQQVPQHIQNCLRAFFKTHPCPPLLAENFDSYLATATLENIASPSANLNSLYPLLAGDVGTYVALQKALKQCFEGLLDKAIAQGLEDSFFIHYAPNLGREESGDEIAWFGNAQQSGTTDFQFMLRGAVKEAGVLALLNHYCFTRTGNYPLGETFNARQTQTKRPCSLESLVDQVVAAFDPALMPTIVGVGDTVTSQQQGEQIKRGGSDRNFLQLIQALNQPFNKGNLTVYVDSSGGELDNRIPLVLAEKDGVQQVIKGPGDAQDPLTLNVAFPGGHQQYCQVFETAARDRPKKLAK